MTQGWGRIAQNISGRPWLARLVAVAGFCWVAALVPAQTLGLASLAWLPETLSPNDERLAGRVMEELECGILDYFFGQGYIGFNIPARLVVEGSEGAARANLEFINLGSAMERGGAQAGILAEAWIGFSRNPDRAYVKELRLSSLRLVGPGQAAGDALINPLARSIRLPGSNDGSITVLLDRISRAFPQVLVLN